MSEKNLIKPQLRKLDIKATLKNYLQALAFMSPFLFGMIIFWVYPFINVMMISLKEGYSILTSNFNAYGFGNYQMIFNDVHFVSGLMNTGKYVLFVVPISTLIALLIATLLNNKIKFQGFFQTCYFLPLVTSVTAIGLVWRWIYNFDYGLLNYLLSLFGVGAINWLNNPNYNLVALVIYGVWAQLPYTIILLLAGLQNINPQYYTAAKADGAKTTFIFFRITVPLLAPTLGLTIIVNTIFSSQVFTELFPLFNGKPGAAYSLYTVVYYLYEKFYVKWDLGPAAASAMILFAIILIFTIIQMIIQRRWKHY